MIYFSELKGKKVFSEDLIEIGYLDDLILRAVDKPVISKLIIQNKENKALIIPSSFLKKIDRNLVIIKKEFEVSNLEENELYIVKNLLDKQIIDLSGDKVVRVNDVVIQDKEDLYLSGVDIGPLGILRWFKIEQLALKFLAKFNIRITSKFLSWADIQPLELARGQVKLKKEEKRLEKLRPEDLADYLEKTNILNIKKILKILDEKFAAEVISNLNLSFQTSLFKQLSKEKAAKIIDFIDSDDAVDILLTVAPKKRNEIPELVEPEKKAKLIHLLQHSSSPIGEVMRTDLLTVKPSDSVRNVINTIKKETEEYYHFNIVYVVNDKNELIGLFDLHALLMQDLDTPVYKFMIQNVIVAHLTTPREIVVKRILKYRLYSLPVVNEAKNLLGLVTLGDLLE